VTNVKGGAKVNNNDCEEMSKAEKTRLINEILDYEFTPDSRERVWTDGEIAEAESPSHLMDDFPYGFRFPDQIELNAQGMAKLLLRLLMSQNVNASLAWAAGQQILVAVPFDGNARLRHFASDTQIGLMGFHQKPLCHGTKCSNIHGCLDVSNSMRRERGDAVSKLLDKRRQLVRWQRSPTLF
jgi:hypothetical protein